MGKQNVQAEKVYLVYKVNESVLFVNETEYK